MKLIAWIKCRWFSVHHGPVVRSGGVEVTEKKNKKPMILRYMPIRKCIICGIHFGSPRDLMNMGA